MNKAPNSSQSPRLTKIVATVGPASNTPDQLKRLIAAGVNVFRINYSHGTHADHTAVIQAIRDVEPEFNPIAILADMQGPKLRVGKLPDSGVELVAGRTVEFSLDGKLKGAIPIPHPEIFASVAPGDHFLIDDGRLRCEVTSVTEDVLMAKVIYGGKLTSNKGVNLPQTDLKLPALTEKDKKDLQHALDQGVDLIALSFVQKAQDLLETREIIANHKENPDARLIAKIEKPLAVDRLESITEACDGLMVARGDLGVELPPEQVPAIQKRLIDHARHVGKPVIVATQMLESMVNAPSPTRAEASDVATAVFQGADAVMLSAESASGAYPIESVQMMARIICQVESEPSYGESVNRNIVHPESSASGAIIASTYRAWEALDAQAILTLTTTGNTAVRVSRLRPLAPIISICHTLQVCRQMALYWGITGFYAKKIRTMAELVMTAPQIARQLNLVAEGDDILLTAGEPFGVSGGTNTLRVYKMTAKDMSVNLKGFAFND